MKTYPLSIILYYCILMLTLLISCQNETSFIAPNTTESYLQNSTKISDAVKKNINGIYTLEGKAFQISPSVAIKCTENYITIFCGKNIDYFLLKGGVIDSGIVFEGYWRVAESLSSGFARFQIKNDEGASELLQGKDPQITIRGSYNVTGEEKQVTFKKTGSLKDDSDFYIIAHRGGGRNSDYLTVSENSLPMIKLSEAFGANSIEIDVRLTQDNIPILYHDEEFNSRLILSEFLIGPVENFPFSHIRTFGRLLNGETIPTLPEVLDVVINETKLKLVWLDLKSPAAIDVIAPIIKEYMKKAKNSGRKVSFVMGLNSEDLRDKYLSNPEFSQYESLSELSIDDTKKLNADYWAPRWTLGSLTNEVNQMHSDNRKVLVWTMDDRQFIIKYLRESNFDGILTNYPAIVAYEYFFK